MDVEHATILKRLYKAFNARDVDSALALMDRDVIWANGLEGGHVRGREGVRAYWTRQWQEIESYAEPLSINEHGGNIAEVDVHLTGLARNGQRLFDTIARHRFRFEARRVCAFDIIDAG